MGTCWGITKNIQFCKKSTSSKWFCSQHRMQCRYFAIISLTSIFFSYASNLIPMPWKKDKTLIAWKERSATEYSYLSIDIRTLQDNIFDADFIFNNNGNGPIKNVKVIVKMHSTGINLTTGGQLKLVGHIFERFPLMELGDIRGRDNKTGRMRDPWKVLKEEVPLLSGFKGMIQWDKAITCLIVSFETELGEKKQLDFGALIDKKNNIDHWITRPCDDYRDLKRAFK